MLCTKQCLFSAGRVSIETIRDRQKGNVEEGFIVAGRVSLETIRIRQNKNI